MAELKPKTNVQYRGLAPASTPGNGAAWTRRLNGGTVCKRLRISPSSPKSHRRRAAVLIAVIVCVAVAGMILMSIAKIAAARRHVMRTELWRVQATWLAESGLERAAWRLAADADYKGETWNLSAEQLAGTDGALVTIEVERIPQQANRRLVRVRADYPDHPRRRARHSKQVVVQLLQPTGEEP